MWFQRRERSDKLEIRFRYPQETGYFFLEDEVKEITVAYVNRYREELTFGVFLHVFDYEGKKVFAYEGTGSVEPGAVSERTYRLRLPGLGYYRVVVEAWSPVLGGTMECTGLGVIRNAPVDLSEESPFGLSCNYWYPDKQFPVFRRMGAKYLRVGDAAPTDYAAAFRRYGLAALTQHMGVDERDIGSRYVAPAHSTARAHMADAHGIVRMSEHGNECFQEHNLTLLSEWTKVSSLAKWDAAPDALICPSGIAGSDVHRFEHFYREGVWPYITCLSLHAYTFPKAPEAMAGFWSFEGLRELAALNDRAGAVPVICSEQGYPAMDDQLDCESYSPEDMVTKEAQADYLVRKYVLLLSYGVRHILWFNGPWYNGFGILDREGLSPWPAGVAFCEMTRQLCRAAYVGDLELGEGVYVKVFDRGGEPIAVAWKPVLQCRSFDPTCNYTMDGTRRESELNGLPLERVVFPYFDEGTRVTDIFGRSVAAACAGGCGEVWLGESPLYLTGLCRDILAEAARHDRRMFPAVKQHDAPPPQVILGIQDETPAAGAYQTAQILPGETRRLVLRVHNFTAQPLNDTLRIIWPDGITGDAAVTVAAAPGETVSRTLPYQCLYATPEGTGDITAALASGAALPVFQPVRIGVPVALEPVTALSEDVREMTVLLVNPGERPITYTVAMQVPGFLCGTDAQVLTLESGGRGTLAFPMTALEGAQGELAAVTVEAAGRRATYTTVVPYRAVRRRPQAQPLCIAGEYTRMSLLERVASELSGEARPDCSVQASACLYVDDGRLYVTVDVHDDEIVCVQTTRRNNIDSDGVWFDIYEESGDQPAYRFCMTPTDPSGRPEGAILREFASGEPWKTPYSTFDLSVVTFRSELWDAASPHGNGYTLHMSIPLAAVGIPADADHFDAGFRVIDMDRGDWPQFYDTGKVRFLLV